jgi:apolipoprotein N-acyltransferase
VNSILVRYPATTALAAGLLTPLSFSPFDWFFIAPLTLACLFVVWLDVPVRRRATLAFVFGIGMFGAGVSWVYISLHTFGDMPLALAIACLVGFVMLLALFPAAAAAATGLFPGASITLRLLVVFPVLWVLAEFARNHLLTGFSWLESGYSQVPTPVGQWAPVVGVHGVSLLTAISAGLIASALLSVAGRRIVWLLLLLVPVASGYIVSRVEWTTAAGEPVRAALVQGNIPLSTKWDFEAATAVARRYLELSRSVEDVDIIIWPESPLPFFIDQMGSRFYDEVVSLPAPLLSGFLERRPADGGFDYHNSAVLFSEPVHMYRKRHLVPFGEYTPLPKLFEPLVAFFDVPMSVLTPWTEEQGPMPIAGRMAGVSICYEDAFPGDIRGFAADSQFLINITEDAWFGDSLAPWQRLQMAQMRSMETARPMFRSSNTGLASIIDHHGRVLAVSPRFEEHVMQGALQPRTGTTPYVRFGDWPLLLLLATALAIAAVRCRRNSDRRS